MASGQCCLGRQGGRRAGLLACAQTCGWPPCPAAASGVGTQTPRGNVKASPGVHSLFVAGCRGTLVSSTGIPGSSSGLLCQPLEVVVAEWVDAWYVESVSSAVGRYVAFGVT